MAIRNLCCARPTPQVLGRYLKFALQGTRAVHEVHQTVPSLHLASTLVSCLPKVAIGDPTFEGLMESSLDGVDCNDDTKTRAATMFAQDVCLWLCMGSTGASSTLSDADTYSMELAASWGPRMLERVLSVVENEGRRDKAKNANSATRRVAGRAEQADKLRAHNLGQTTSRLFKAASGDDGALRKMVEEATRFLGEGAAGGGPDRGKAATYVARALVMRCGARGFGRVMEAVGGGSVDGASDEALAFKVRALSGAVKEGGLNSLRHWPAITKALAAAARSKVRAYEM